MIDFKLTPIEQNGQRVLTTAQLAEAYGTDVKVISNNFNRNINRYTEGKHFYRLTGDELKEFKACHQIEDKLKFAPFLILWTERGSLLHAKSLNTDTAWEAYDYLLEYYFRTREINNSYAELIELLRSEIKSDKEETINMAVEKAVSETVKVLAPYMKAVNTKTLTKKISPSGNPAIIKTAKWTVYLRE